MKRLQYAPVLSTVHKLSNGAFAPIKLTKAERYAAAIAQQDVNRKFRNALGYEVPITTLSGISKRISEQHYYEIAFADYLPVLVGENTWMSNITTFRSYDAAGTFEDGYVNQGSESARLASSNAAVDALNIKVNNWANEVSWNIFELEQAARNGNWDIVAAKQEAMKRTWDLGLQRIAFLGAKGLNGSGGSCLGLLNQPTGQFDASLITLPISSMSTTQLATFQQNAIQVYRAQVNYTRYPTHFIMPELDYNGLANQSSPDFPIKSKLVLLQEAFAAVTHNRNFKILPLTYAQYSIAGAGVLPAGVGGGAGSGLYTFLNYDEKSLKMEVPLPYTNTLANSVNNFNFNMVGYGQHTGVLLLRPLELYYAGF